MRRAWIVAAGVFVFLILITIGIQYRSTHPRVPVSLQPQDCDSTAPPDELPNTRFLRKGGRRTRYVKVWNEGSALTTADVAQGRDLTAYDRLEVTDPEPRTVSDRGRDPYMSQARTFLWEHWHARKRGYLILTGSSVDATSTSHVFVEKDELGRWRVYWRIVRHHSEVDDSPTAYSMRWVIPNGWDQPSTPLGDGQAPDPVRHRLEFRDICGDFQASF
jgi:hypothetical protein